MSRPTEGGNFSPQPYEPHINPSMRTIPPDVLAFFRDRLTARHKLTRQDAEHQRKSFEAIRQSAGHALRTAPADTPKTALILGAGRCSDIPLQWLATHFDHITLVDINRTRVEEAIEKLPPVLQPKVAIVIADITGIGGEIGAKIQANLSPTHSAFRENVRKVLNETDVKGKPPTDLGNNYTFVTSHLVMSQLPAVVGAALEVHPARHAIDLSPSDYPAFLKDYLRFVNLLQREHIRYLARLSASRGIVHLADTYASKHTAPQSSGAETLVDANMTDPVVNRYFSSLLPQPTMWQWKYEPTITYHIFASTLQKKD